MNCILPHEIGSALLGGWNRVAVVYDTDSTFDICRFRALLRYRITTLLPPDGSDAAEEIIINSLSRLQIFRPASSSELAMSLLHLEDFHATNAHLRDSEIALILVDSLSAFYWTDRFTSEQFRGHQDAGSMVQPLQQVRAALERIRSLYDCVVVYTSWRLPPRSKPLPVMEQPTSLLDSDSVPQPMLLSVQSQSTHQNTDSIRRDAFMETDAAPTDAEPHQPLVSVAVPLVNPQYSALNMPITHHISLTPAYLPPFPSNLPLVDVLEQEEGNRIAVTDRGRALELVVQLGNGDVERFSLCISAQDVTVEPIRTNAA